MPRQSIFHRLVTSEDDYSALLCTLLKRDSEFREKFIALTGFPVAVTPEQIGTQQILPGLRADLHIESAGSALSLIVEVKIGLHEPLRESQKLDETERPYRKFLEQKQANGYNSAFLYLVPSGWEFTGIVLNSIKTYETQRGHITAKLIFWEDIMQLLPDNPGPDHITLDSEVYMQLLEKFGSIYFLPEEVERIFGNRPSLSDALKLNAFIHAMGNHDRRKELTGTLPEVKTDISKTEIGLNLEVAGRPGSFFFGSWRDFAETQDWRRPLCFGFDSSKIDGAFECFSSALSACYDQKPIPFSDTWFMGYVPREDLLKRDAQQQTLTKISHIFQALEECPKAGNEGGVLSR